MFKHLKIDVTGGSHDKYIKCVLSGNIKGIKINHETIETFLELRRGIESINTPRKENDKYEFLSGVENDIITSDIIEFIVYNTNVLAKDYKLDILRPLHADYIMHMQNDYQTGGGVFSGRITVIYVILGAILSNYTKSYISGHISTVGNISDVSIKNNSFEQSNFPVIDENVRDEMLNYIMNYKKQNISVGANLEFKISNVEELLGGFLFNSLESYITANLFAIPGVKGVTFGDYKNGTLSSEVIDTYEIINDSIKSNNNFNGGINGGFSNGYEDIILNVIMRPTPTTSNIQPLFKNNNGKIEILENNIVGRHDSFIANRAVIVIISMLYITMFDMKRSN